MIKLVMQPKNSSLCGQACVAMIAGVSLEESIAVFKTRGATTTKMVIAALRSLGIPCSDSLISLKKQPKSQTCIVIQHFKDVTFTHWVVYYDGLYYDPSWGIAEAYDSEFVRETSYLPIWIDMAREAFDGKESA